GYARRLELRLENLHDVNEDIPPRLFLEIVPQLVDLRALAAYDDPGPGRVDRDLQLVGGALDVGSRHARVRQTLLELLAQRHVLVEQRRVVLLGVPAGLPGLVE